MKTDAAIRERLDGMTEAPNESCAGCEYDCYCQVCPNAVAALRAVLDELSLADDQTSLTDSERGCLEVSDKVRRVIARELGIEVPGD